MDYSRYLLLSTLLFIQPFMSMAATNLTTDQSTLLELKQHIVDPHGFLSNNWSNTASVCHWTGVSCDDSQGRVTVLDLSDMDLNGTIAPQLGNLSSLVSLKLSGNNFHGYLPQELAKLPRLELVDLSQNAFGGEIPSWLGNLTTLKALYLGGNNFQGNIPVEIGKLLALETFAAQNMSLITGPIPPSIFNISSLKEIYLNNNSLSGSISNDMCHQLPKLQVLYLYQNELSGNIPSNIGDCSNLQNFSLSINRFSGFIPDGIGNLTKLKLVYLGYNSLEGHIPSNIGGCNNLQVLSLMENRLSGSIPRSIGNLTRLKELYLLNNVLDGEIPWEIRNLVTVLEIFDASHMRIGGLLPDSIFNSSSLRMINLQNNSISGKLPLMISTPNLEELRLWQNNLSGNIPESISNTSKLRILSLNLNSFSGFIPDTLGNLNFLEVLRLWSNQFTTKNPTLEWTFFSSLAKCKNLRVLELSSNPLNGILPTSISNLSASVEEFGASDCKIKGTIPVEIGNLSNIMSLDFSQNELSGSIPATTGRLLEVQGLYFADNILQGSIPYSICQLKSLSELDLSGNVLQGPIPMCFGDLISMRSLYLDSNKLDSTIPFSFWGLKDILRVDLSSNYLNGSLPLDIGNLKVLTYLNLSRNLLSSDIPITIGGLTGLQILFLSNNRLQGPIPESLGDLTSLETLDLSENNLSGTIPMSLEKLSYLSYFNVAFNRLEGQIPAEGCFENFSAKSFMNNYALCGSPRFEVPPCDNSSTQGPSKRSSMHVLKYVLPPTASVILIFAFIIVIKKCHNKSTNSSMGEDLSKQEIHSRNLYNRILQATDEFSEDNLLGSGSFGSVYKGRLSNGRNVAVKVFNLQLEGAFDSFAVECEVMQSILHRNLVKVISCCSCTDFKALVLEFLPNGSLEQWLYSDNYFLDIIQRINIMIDVGSALEYLHLGHPNPIIHCDLKPSNVLLDEDMVAHVGDFGIAKMLGEAESMKQTMTLATIGYMAPEYGSTGIISTKSDVYSYGILLMETFTRKKPTNEYFVGEMSMKRWVEESLSNGTSGFVDSSLFKNEVDQDFTAKADCISSIMRLALTCSAELPEERKDMKDVVSILKKIKKMFLIRLN